MHVRGFLTDFKMRTDGSKPNDSRHRFRLGNMVADPWLDEATWPLPWLVGAAIVSSVVITGPTVIAEYVAVSPWGSDTALMMSFVASIPAVVVIFGMMLVGILCLPMLFVPKVFKIAFKFLITSGVFILCAIAVIRYGGNLRIEAFRQLAARRALLVSTIERFEQEHHRPPTGLSELVPGYLPSIPSTGMPVYPDYEFEIGYAGSEFDDRWRSFVQTPSAGINWDQFYYIPSQNYPENGFGGSIEKVGGWAYVHE